MKKYISIVVLSIIIMGLIVTINNKFSSIHRKTEKLKAPVINIHNDEKLELDGISLYSEVNSNELFIHTYKIKKEDKILSLPISYETNIAKFILRAKKENIVIAEHKFTMDRSYIGSEKTYDIYLKQKNGKIYFER
ncbi:MAG: hypothetical protein FH753_14205 [Firmicutes bacterium]|nr:hypothetical protein [Bacillota bacterium]